MLDILIILIIIIGQLIDISHLVVDGLPKVLCHGID